MAPPARGVSAETDGAPEPPPVPRGCSAAAALGGLGWARMDGTAHAGCPEGLPLFKGAHADLSPPPIPKPLGQLAQGRPGRGGEEGGTELRSALPGKGVGRNARPPASSAGIPLAPRQGHGGSAAKQPRAQPPRPLPAPRAVLQERRKDPGPPSRGISPASAAGWEKAVPLHPLPAAGAAPRRTACGPGRRCPAPTASLGAEAGGQNAQQTTSRLENLDARRPPGRVSSGVQGAGGEGRSAASSPSLSRRPRRAPRMGQESPQPTCIPRSAQLPWRSEPRSQTS